MTDETRSEIVNRLDEIRNQLAALGDAVARTLAARDAMLEKELARKLDEALDLRDRALREEFAKMLGRDGDDWWKEGGSPPWS
jgi:uncharacterized protein YpiB (UPF0302 family)